MKVCLATLEYPPFFGGGISTYCANLARGLVREGCEVYVLTTIANDTEKENNDDDGPRVVRVSEQRLREHRRPYSFLSHTLPETVRLLSCSSALSEELAHMHQKVLFDIVDSPEVQCLNFSFSDYHELRNLPQVLTLHGSIIRNSENEPAECRTPDRRICEQVELSAILMSDGLIGSSSNSKSYWQKRTGKPVDIVAPPFEPTGYSLEPDNIGKVPDKYLLVVGRLQSLKGIEDLAKAFADIAEQFPALHVVSVGKNTHSAPGGSSMADHLRSLLKELWQSRWHWIPSLLPAELAWVRKRAFMSVCPSRWEAFGYTVTEAMADGIPTIVSDGAGVADICTDGENTLIFHSGDVNGLSECIKRLWEDDVLCKRLIEGGYRTVQNELDLARTTRERISIYRRVIDAAGTAGARKACNKNSVYEEILNHLAKDGRIPALGNYRAGELISELGRRAKKKWRRYLHM